MWINESQLIVLDGRYLILRRENKSRGDEKIINNFIYILRQTNAKKKTHHRCKIKINFII